MTATELLNRRILQLADNVISLNSNLGVAGAGATLDSGISINRGSATAKTFIWNETTDKWTIGAETFVAGTVEAAFTGVVGGVTPAAVTGTTITANTGFVGNVTGNAAGAHTGTFDGDMTGTMSGDDSTILVDGINNKVVGNIDTASLRTSESEIALGYNAGETTQGNGAVAIGYLAGETNQAVNGVSLGARAGQTTQGIRSVAVGADAGNSSQGEDAVAVGYTAGRNDQGANAIAIGRLAGETNQAANSIVLNATGSAVQNTTASSTVIQPVRNQASANVMMYDPANGELTHTATPGTLAANIDQATLAIGAATATTIGIGNAGSTTTINGILSSPALVSGNITADDSMQITTAVGTNNGITLNPQGTGTSVNITSDAIRTFGSPFTDAIIAQAGVVGDLKGSVVADDSTVLIDGVAGKVMLTTNTTTELTEGTNLYYTDVRADARADARITNAGSANWNTAYGWGDHSVAGYQVAGAPHDGDMTGSLYGDDSTVMVDGVAGKIVGPISRIVGDVQQISGPGVISLDTLVTEITTTGADAYTLADGVAGQIKIIAMIVDGGDGTLTPTTLATGTTITFNDINDNISLLYTTNGWVNTANQGAVIA